MSCFLLCSTLPRTFPGADILILKPGVFFFYLFSDEINMPCSNRSRSPKKDFSIKCLEFHDFFSFSWARGLWVLALEIDFVCLEQLSRLHFFCPNTVMLTQSVVLKREQSLSSSWLIELVFRTLSSAVVLYCDISDCSPRLWIDNTNLHYKCFLVSAYVSKILSLSIKYGLLMSWYGLEIELKVSPFLSLVTP